MIARNSKWPFGGRITVIHTPSFKCVISTNKEAIFKPLSTMIFEGDTMDGNARVVAKIIYSPALRKDDIQNLHFTIVNAINNAGEDGSTLGETLHHVFNYLKETGLASEAINLAS